MIFKIFYTLHRTPAVAAGWLRSSLSEPPDHKLWGLARGSTPAPRRRLGWLLIALALAALTGCSVGEELETSYGRRAGRSVNGVGVLSEMFRQAGHRITSWRVLSPRLYEADTIVWAPDRFTPPSEGTIEWFNDWLSSDPSKTLVYIGRDYDAEIAYWDQVAPTATGAQAAEIAVRHSGAKTQFNLDRQELKNRKESDWFDIQTKSAPVKIKTLAGPWSQGVDPRKTEIVLRSDLDLPDDFEPLLESPQGPLAARCAYDGEGQLIIISNGSFLLNYPLVNHEHRKLAKHLIGAVSPGEVVFLETGGENPEILDEDPSNEVPTGLEIFSVWPLNFILLHLAILGLIFAFARAPIFGVPKTLPTPPLSDFGRHVGALGDLLEKTHDQAYAQTQIQDYFKKVRGEK